MPLTTEGLRSTWNPGRFSLRRPRVSGRGASFLCARRARDAAPNPDGLIVTLVTEDVDGWFDRLRTRGIAIEKAPPHNPACKITHGFRRDPNGYLVEIQRLDDPMWRGPRPSRFNRPPLTLTWTAIKLSSSVSAIRRR